MFFKIKREQLYLNVIYFLFVIGFFRGTAISGFTIFNNLHFIDQLFTVFQYTGIIYIIQRFFSHYHKIEKHDIMLWVFLLLIFLSTALSGVDIGEAVSFIGRIFFVMLWFKTIYHSKNTLHLCAFVNGLNAIQIINFVFMIVFYGGAEYANSNTIMGTTGHVYLLGYDNGLIMYALPTIVLDYYLYDLTQEKKYKWIIMLLAMQIIISLSVTGIIAISLVVILFNMGTLAKLFSGFRGIVISALVFLGLASMKIQTWIEPVLDTLGRGITLGGRTEIWQWAYEYIVKSPILGYGYNTERAQKVFFWRIGITAAHGQFIDLLLQGGIIGLALYLIIYIYSEKGAYLNYKLTKSKFWKLTCIVESVMFFIMIVESYSSYSAYPLLFVLLELGYKRIDRTDSNALSFKRELPV